MNPRDFRPTFTITAADLTNFLNNDPTAFDALLFRAIRSNKEQVTDVEDLVGSMEASEKIIEYEDPVPVRATERPFEFPVLMDGTSEYIDGYTEEPVVMFIGGDNIPKASVLAYDEYDDANSNSISRRILYVEKIESITKHPGAANLYFMLPFLDYEEKFGGAA